ncbi:MAG: 30S ribosomal protein S19e [Candidatus Nanohaloarchaea archaeon]|nr:30S ribosomal protein S19e [Candidatus Nanohaloarchaea archaeon]
MTTVYDVRANPLIESAAENLKDEIEEIEQPDWSTFVRTGPSRERSPEQEDWWYVRAAAVLRKIYMDGPLGVEKLRTVYGSKRRRGHQTEHFHKASGKVIRTILQQLEETGLVELEEGKGRKITEQGQSFLDKLASELE